MTAKVQLMFRARRVHAHAIEDRWEFRDDAGSGIRGKSHTESVFRFTAFLDNGVDTPDDHTENVHQDIRVWSKGNCPDRKRKITKKKTCKKRYCLYSCFHACLSVLSMFNFLGFSVSQYGLTRSQKQSQEATQRQCIANILILCPITACNHMSVLIPFTKSLLCLPRLCFRSLLPRSSP
jgi:hypothetical protein